MTLLLRAIENPGPYAWAAPWYKELKPITKVIDDFAVPGLFKHSTKINIQSVGPVYSYVQLFNGAEINFMSVEKEDTFRGLAYKGIVNDEAPSMRRERWEKEQAPTLMDYGGWVIFIGSPKGRNWFHELYLKGQDTKANPDWESWSQSSYVNTVERGGFLKTREIDLIRDQLPELARRQEIYGEFLEGEGTVFRNVDASIAGQLGDPEQGRRYTIGVDLAKTQDWTVLLAIDDRGQVRGFDRFNQLDWDFQKKRIKVFADRYGGLVTLDSTGVGDPIYEDLNHTGVRIQGFKFTAESKRQLIENLSIAMDKREITFPGDLGEYGNVLANELKAYTYDITSQGNIHYGAPEGLHDDAVIALALAVWGMTRASGPVDGFIFG